MAEKKNASCFGARAEARFEQVAVVLLPVELYASAADFGFFRCQGHATVDGRFVVGWGLDFNQLAGELDQFALGLMCSSKEAAHGYLVGHLPVLERERVVVCAN
jgi:hypothetical protein